MDAHFCNEGQLLDLRNNNAGAKEGVEDVKLGSIDVAT